VGRSIRKISIIFILLQAVLYAAFLMIDLSGSHFTLSSGIKYGIIVLCFCYALLSKKGADKGILFVLKAGLFFTLISDLFILLLDIYFYGVLTFIIVQQLYGIRISMAQYPVGCAGRTTLLLRSFLIRLALQLGVSALICIILTGFGVSLEGLLVASVFYFISIFTNTLRALKAAVIHSRDKVLRIFAAGMVLFLLCDINVGLFNMTGFISLPDNVYNTIYSFAAILMWTFYAPSQVLIALSVHEV